MKPRGTIDEREVTTLEIPALELLPKQRGMKWVRSDTPTNTSATWSDGRVEYFKLVPVRRKP